MTAIVTGCATAEEEALMDQSINVGITKAYIGSQETEGTYIGVIENTESVSVVPLVSGTVDEVNYVVGDTVSAGAVLCHFDDTTARQNYAVAKTGLKNAKASLASAQANYNSTVASTAQNVIIQHNASDYKTQKDIEGGYDRISDFVAYECKEPIPFAGCVYRSLFIRQGYASSCDKGKRKGLL